MIQATLNPDGQSGSDLSTFDCPRPRSRPELYLLGAILVALNLPVLTGSFSHQFIVLPEAVTDGQWWRLLTHPFVHVSWYHLLLDGLGFLILYCSLQDTSLFRRAAFVAGGVVGSAITSWATLDLSTGLCGLSGTAHGLMAVSALEMIAASSARSPERRIGWISFLLVVGKAGSEALTGRMFLESLHFGLMGTPIAVSHAGGIVGALLVYVALWPRGCRRVRGRGE